MNYSIHYANMMCLHSRQQKPHVGILAVLHKFVSAHPTACEIAELSETQSSKARTIKVKPYGIKHDCISKTTRILSSDSGFSNDKKGLS